MIASMANDLLKGAVATTIRELTPNLIKLDERPSGPNAKGFSEDRKNPSTSYGEKGLTSGITSID